MKKKIFTVILAMAMVLSFGLAGCGSVSPTDSGSSGSSESSGTGESGKKVLKLGIECTYSPYNWTQQTEDLPNGQKAVKIANADGYAYGYDVALAQKICDQLGWDLEVYKSDWTAIFMGLQDGTYDCIMSGVCYSEERDKTYDFTTTYYQRQIKAVVREDSEFADVTSLSGFDGKKPKVIAQLSTNYVDYKDQVPSMENSVDYESASELFLAIQNSTADVLITDRATAESALSTMSGLKMLDLDKDDDFKAPEGASNSCCILFRGDDEECKTVQKALDEMGWTDKTDEGLQKMNDLMSEMIKLQPSSN